MTRSATPLYRPRRLLSTPCPLPDPTERARVPGEGIGRMGLLRLIHRLGEAAGIEQVRCSPHSLRHTFAIQFLRNGGNVFSLQQLMGHRSIRQTEKYLLLAQADMEAQHRMASPVEALLRKRKG
jgi:site-specific recombinase XerD